MYFGEPNIFLGAQLDKTCSGGRHFRIVPSFERLDGLINETVLSN